MFGVLRMQWLRDPNELWLSQSGEEVGKNEQCLENFDHQNKMENQILQFIRSFFKLFEPKIFSMDMGDPESCNYSPVSLHYIL